MGKNKVTMREISAESGLSLATVCRALKDDDSVSRETRARILEAKQSLERKAKSGREGLSGVTVGILMPDFYDSGSVDHPSILSIISSFSQRLNSLGVLNSNIIIEKNGGNAGKLAEDLNNGYLLIGMSEEQERAILTVLGAKKKPAVLVNRQTDLPYTGGVSMDDQNAIYKATAYLIKKGYKDIAFVGGNRNFQNTRRRLLGYRAAMADFGMNPREENILFGEYSEESGKRIADILCGRSARPEAGVFASDPMAIGCIKRLQERGLSVPGDFAVFGFGDIEACQYVSPTLSTVLQPDREVGINAAEMLIQMINNPKVLSMNMLLKTELVIREST